MKKINKYILSFVSKILMLFLLIGISSCTEETKEDHYYKIDSRLNSNIIEVLESDQNYSKFVEQLKKTEYYELLKTSLNYSIWVPSNDVFVINSDVSNDEDDLKQFIGNHISLNTYTSTSVVNSIENLISVKMLNNKNIDFKIDNNGLTFGDVLIDTNNKDILASNGVLHQVESVLNVKENIWNYINNNTDAYPILTDYFEQFNILSFNENESVITGTNSLGGVIYDSIFNQSNSVFEKIGDLASEEERFTFVALTDEVYNSIYSRFEDLYFHPIEDSTVVAINKNIFENLNYQFINRDELDGVTPSLTTSNSEVVIDDSSIQNEISLSNGSILLLDEYNFNESSVLKPIRYEIENTSRRTISSLADLSVQSVYDRLSSGEFTNKLTLLGEPSDSNYLQVNFSNVLAGDYKIKVKYSSIGASQQTQMKYKFRYSNGRGTRVSSITLGPYNVSHLENGVITLADTDGSEKIVSTSIYTDDNIDNVYSVSLQIFIDVSEAQDILYDRQVGIDYVELVPVSNTEE